MLIPMAENSFDLENKSIQGAAEARASEKNGERASRGVQDDPIPQTPGEEGEAPGFRRGFNAYWSARFDEPPLDLGDDCDS